MGDCPAEPWPTVLLLLPILIGGSLFVFFLFRAIFAPFSTENSKTVAQKLREIDWNDKVARAEAILGSKGVGRPLAIGFFCLIIGFFLTVGIGSSILKDCL